MQRLTKQFKAQDDSGKTQTLFVYQDFIRIQGAVESAEVPGQKSIFTANRQHVNVVEKGKYQIVETGLILFSDAPDAE